jgi:hypothetical protein
MQKHPTFFSLLSMITLLVSAVVAQEPMKKAREIRVGPAASGNPVTGSGTAGHISKWTGVFGSNTFTLGDTNIFEDKFGKVGIGTTTPTSNLTVQGMIETTLGGIKFPDGTTQTTAAVTGILSVAHDNTLQGNGTEGSPLGLAVPLFLQGDVGDCSTSVPNPGTRCAAVIAVGSRGNSTLASGSGLLSLGGSSTATSPGGVGLVSLGGNSNSSSLGGTGGLLQGGFSLAGNGGDGLFAVGAQGGGTGKKGGRGIVAIPGEGAFGATAGLAGEFLGDVSISGNLSKGGGSFKIDHPLDPENKYLYHSFVESPDMMNIYNGNTTTDENGDAVVELRDYFEALNRDFRYQLTVIGAFAQAIVAEKVKGNRFRIKTSAPNIEVSWQVTGIRRDAYANKNRIPVEVEKAEQERGYYLHPEAFNQPETRSVEWARNPELMRQMKEQRENARHEKAQRDKAQTPDR